MPLPMPETHTLPRAESPQVVLELTVNNHPGVMSHICGLFARRAFNVEGISACPSAPAYRAASGSVSLPITAWSRCSGSYANWRTWSASSGTALTTRFSYAWRNFSRRRADARRGPALIGHPDRGPDLSELAHDLAPGRADILADVHLAKQAERQNAVGISGMRGQAPHGGIGLRGSGRVSQVSPKSVVRSTCPFSPVVVSPHPAKSTSG